MTTRDALPTRIVLGLLRAYKLVISPLFTGSCRYLPSCSDYAAEAVRLHGVLRGSWLSVRRLSRCHPWGGSGLDPVPSRHADLRGTTLEVDGRPRRAASR